jgi:hypothetical protein
LSVTISELPSYRIVLSDEELYESLLSEDAVSQPPSQGLTMIHYKPTRFDGERGCAVVYHGTIARAAFEIPSIIYANRFLYDNLLIDVSLAWTLVNPATDQDREVSAMFLLAGLIGNSIMIQSKWR